MLLVKGSSINESPQPPQRSTTTKILIATIHNRQVITPTTFTRIYLPCSIFLFGKHRKTIGSLTTEKYSRSKTATKCMQSFPAFSTTDRGHKKIRYLHDRDGRFFCTATNCTKMDTRCRCCRRKTWQSLPRVLLPLSERYWYSHCSIYSHCWKDNRVWVDTVRTCFIFEWGTTCSYSNYSKSLQRNPSIHKRSPRLKQQLRALFAFFLGQSGGDRNIQCLPSGPFHTEMSTTSLLGRVVLVLYVRNDPRPHFSKEIDLERPLQNYVHCHTCVLFQPNHHHGGGRGASCRGAALTIPYDLGGSHYYEIHNAVAVHTATS